MNKKTQSQTRILKFARLLWCCLVLAGSLAAQGDHSQTQRPNIIFFLTDDQGWQDLGSAGHPYLKTPNLDRLAREGMRFEQFYSAASVCSPSRTAFMTGHFPARHRVHQHFSHHRRNRRSGMPDWLDPKAVTVTRLLQKAGYRTGHFGKWHLGHVQGAPEPSAYGIDEYRILAGAGLGWDRHGNPTDTDLALASRGNATDQDYVWTHSTDLIVDQAIAFLDKNQGQSFYLNLWTWLPHSPNRPTAEQLAAYKNLRAKPRHFKSWMRAYAKEAKDLEQQTKVYSAALTSVDTALGRLLGKLDEMGLTDNTLIFFTSDNGPEDYNIGNMSNSGMGATGRFRGRKRSLYEGGIRMPCIARWPGTIPAGRVDKTSVLGAVDWLPTVCRIAGIPLPDIKADGHDVVDILRGVPGVRQRPLFWNWRGRVAGNTAYKSPTLAMRAGKWKLFAQPDGSQVELYDLPKDPGERVNVAERNPGVIARILPRLLDWEQSLPN